MIILAPLELLLAEGVLEMVVCLGLDVFLEDIMFIEGGSSSSSSDDDDEEANSCSNS